MAKQLNIKNWLHDFLYQRGLDKPDGRHLFSYHATPDEFLALEDGLKHSVEVASILDDHNPLAVLNNMSGFNAVFVLYAALCWQQRYDGTTWTYNVVLQGLGITLDNPTQELKGTIENGLAFWGLAVNDKGYVYLGAIAREAGLPQKLLSENRGAVGGVLHSILQEALRSGQSGEIITSWVESCKNQLPQSCRDKAVIELLADSINAILDIKSYIRTATLSEAMAELDDKAPDWRSRFPLPLYDAAARALLNSLLEETASSTQTKKTGSPVSVKRRLVRNAEGEWELLAELELPSRIDTELSDEKPRVLSMRVSSSENAFEAVLKKHADGDFYFFQNMPDITFCREDAAQEILIRYTAPSGFFRTLCCPGGTELDPELPWIFEGEQYECRFRQQGGGSVHGRNCYVALAPGWSAEGTEDMGPLAGTDRHVWRMTESGRLTKDDLVFSVRTASVVEENCDWSHKNRFWDVEMIRPALAFRGLPQVVSSMGDARKSPRGRMLMKTAAMTTFSPPAASGFPAGVAQVWFRMAGGTSLRSHMLLLPPKASVDMSADEEGNGILRLTGWRAENAALVRPQEGLDFVCRPSGEDLEIEFRALPDHVPPATVELLVIWKDSPQQAHIRVPFPQKGARLFNAEEQEILPDRQICALHLHGLRLYCFSTGVRHAALRLSLPGKSLLYPLTISDNGTVIRLMDWQNAFLEMLAMTGGLDARVLLDILFDGRKVAGWSVARYESCLIPEETRAVLALPEHGERPLQGYAMKALLLNHPELGLKNLEEESREDGTPSGAWEVSEALDQPGPWLIFDDTEGTSLRPLLWTMDGEDDTPLNPLQTAIAGKDSTSRQRAFISCTAAMEQDLHAPEWTTLLAVLSHVKHLPLSTLEIWHALIRSPRIMALLALHPGVSFQDITSRVDTELPFLWNFVSRKDWRDAAQAVKDYLGRIISGDMALTFWQRHVQETLEELGSRCPSVNALVHIAVALPCEAEMLTIVRTYYRREKVVSLLFKGDDSEMQTLLRAHADDEWPEAFGALVDKERHDADIRRFLPFSHGPRNSVLGLPVLLTIQAFEPQMGFFSVPPDQDTIFHIREHIHFDAAWFERASTLTAYCCMSERFSIKES